MPLEFLDAVTVLKESVQTILQVHQALSMSEISQVNASFSGTTACMALVHGGKLHTANVGDSRAVIGRLLRGGSMCPVRATKDSKPDDPEVRAT